MSKTSLVACSALGVVLTLGLGVAAQAQDMSYRWAGAPQFSNDDVMFKFRGRILLDYVNQDVTRDGLAVISRPATGAVARCSWASKAS